MDGLSPGCAAAWLVVLGLAIAAVLALRRSLARDRERARARQREIAERSTAAGLAARAGQPFPSELPVTPLVGRWSRPRTCVRADLEHGTLWVFDYEVSGRQPLGRNVEVTGSGDDRSHRSRHTVACVRDRRLALPSFELLPNVEGAMKQAVLGGAGALAQASPLGARLLEGMLDLNTFLHDRRPVHPFSRRPELAAGYRVLGDDGPAIEEALGDATVDLLLAHPSSIVCGSGEWLLCSERQARSSGDLPKGLLPPAAAAVLVGQALDLIETLV